MADPQKRSVWLALIVGAFLMAGGGTVYNYGTYEADLKRDQDYSQTSAALIGVFGDMGLYLGFIVGLFYDRFGPRATCLFGAGALFFGYFVPFLLISAMDHVPPFLLCVCFFLTGQGSHALYTAALMTSVANFTNNHRGKVTGFLAAFFGLSAAMFNLLYSLFDHNVEAYLLFMAIVLAVIALAGAATVRKVKASDRADGFSSHKGVVNAGGEGDEVSLEPDVTCLPMFRRANFWLLFAVVFVMDGGSLMFINNIAQIVHSAWGPGYDELGLRLVAVFSVCSALGRFGIGFASDALSARLSREGFLFSTAVVYTVTMALMFIAPYHLVIPAVVVVGLAFGGMFAIAPVLTADFFGLKFYGTNWGLVIVAPAIGALLFGTMFGLIYDAQAPEGELFCDGVSCFRLAFVIAAVGGVAVTACAYLLVRRRGGWKGRKPELAFSQLLDDGETWEVGDDHSDGEDL